MTTEPTPPEAPPIRRPIWNPTKLFSRETMTAEEKRALPAPVLTGPVTVADGTYSIPFTDWRGMDWLLCAKSWEGMKRNMKYFRQLDRQMIYRMKPVEERIVADREPKAGE